MRTEAIVVYLISVLSLQELLDLLKYLLKILNKEEEEIK